MSDHYEQLGVTRDASKDEIKSAYQARKEGLEGDGSDEARAELGRLNEAWQTLADPYQRGRYDAALESGDADQDAEVVDESDEPTGEQPRRRGLFQPAEPSNRPAPEPTVTLPPGVRLAENRARLNAMLFDLAIVVLLFVGAQLVSQQIVQNQYPDEIDRIQEIGDEVDAIDDETGRRDDVENAIDDLESDIEAAEEAGEPTSELEDQLAEARAATDTLLSEIEERTAELQAELDSGDLSESAASDTQDDIDALDLQTELVNSSDSSLETRRESLVEEDDDLRSELQPANIITVLAGTLLGLVYLVGFGLRNGQTIGKRIRNVRVIEVDGGPLTFRSALVRYGLPAVFSALTFLFLGPLGFALAIFGVLLWMRSPNRQGLHDRAARTLVVEDTPSGTASKGR